MKHGLSLLVISLIFCNLQGWAADQSAKPAPTMGRLFFSPNDRASLDNIRQNSKAPDKLIKADEPEKEEQSIDVEAEPSKRIIVKGYVSRTDGKNTVWVNDKAMAEHSSNKDITVGTLQKNSGKIQVTIKGTEQKTIALKAGQVYDPNTGRLYNHLSEGLIPIVEQEKTESVMEKASQGMDELKKKVMDLFTEKSSVPSNKTTVP